MAIVAIYKQVIILLFRWVGQQKSYVCLQGGWVGQKRAKNMLMHPHLVLSKFAANNYKRIADLEKMALTFSKKSYPKI